MKNIFTFLAKRVVHLACGGYHVICCTEDGELYSWGYNEKSQLGLSLYDDKETSRIFTPHKIKGPENFVQKKIAKLCCGERHSMALTSEGEVWSWGGSESDKYPGVLGHGDDLKVIALPRKIEWLKGMVVVDIECGWHHSLCLTKDGKVRTRRAHGLTDFKFHSFDCFQFRCILGVPMNMDNLDVGL